MPKKRNNINCINDIFSSKRDLNNKSKYHKKSILNNNKKILTTLKPKYNVSKKELKKFLEKSPNEMDYDEALKDDKRTFIEMYKENLLDNHLLLNSIFEEDKYKPSSIKMIIYALRIDLYFVINGLFYSESYIDELFNSEEEDNFWSFVPRSIERIVYTSIIGGVIDFFVDLIIVSGDKIKKKLIAHKRNESITKGEISNISFRVVHSITIFIIISFITMLFSFYYISCFNYAYSNTKIEWIKSSIFIYLLNEIFSFFYMFGLSLLRYISIRCEFEMCYKLLDRFTQ